MMCLRLPEHLFYSLSPMMPVPSGKKKKSINEITWLISIVRDSSDLFL